MPDRKELIERLRNVVRNAHPANGVQIHPDLLMIHPDLLIEAADTLERDAAESAPTDGEQCQARILSDLSTIRGHLEGYADVLALTETFNKGMLVKSLREDAEILGSITQVEEMQDSD